MFDAQEVDELDLLFLGVGPLRAAGLLGLRHLVERAVDVESAASAAGQQVAAAQQDNDHDNQDRGDPQLAHRQSAEPAPGPASGRALVA